MATIKEDYVSFETAKLLREKGFKEPTLAYAYGQDMVAYYSQPKVTDDYNVEAGRFPLPTLQMACKWLRKVYNIHIVPIHIENITYRVKINGLSIFELDKPSTYLYGEYEYVIDFAIKYCIENLI